MAITCKVCRNCRWWKEPDVENDIGICDLIDSPCVGEYWCSGFQKRI